MDHLTRAPSRRLPTREEIAERAYDRFIGRGAQHGADVSDWLKAERDLVDAGSPVESSGLTGISNRESAREEDEERQLFPPIDLTSPEPQDAAGRIGEQPLEETRNRHTSHKTGSRSTAQKEAGSRYLDRPMPAATKVDGAFGKEPQEPPRE